MQMKRFMFASGLVLSLGFSALAAQGPVKAVGGVVTNYTDADGISWIAHVFKSVGTNSLAVTTPGEVEYLIGGGAHVWMHLCGNVTAILPDLIDIGLNVLNPVQPQAMDVRELAREFGGKVCFNGGVDVQGTLVRGTPEDVRREVHKLVSLFGKFNGGYIGGTSHGVMPETPLDNVIAMYEAFAEYLPQEKGGEQRH